MRPAHRINDMDYVEGAMEGWARWCLSAGSPREVSMTGRIMDGARPGICPGWLRDFMRNKAHDPHCPDCGGRGRIRAHGSRSKINPVCIRSTRDAGGPSHTDIYEAIDELICSWQDRDETYWLHRVAIAEYLWLAMRQEDKAVRLRISRAFYGQNLNEVRHQVELRLKTV